MTTSVVFVLLVLPLYSCMQNATYMNELKVILLTLDYKRFKKKDHSHIFLKHINFGKQYPFIYTLPFFTMSLFRYVWSPFSVFHGKIHSLKGF